MSIRLRLTLWYSGILTFVLLLFGVGLYIFLHLYVYDDLSDSLKEQADVVTSRIQYRPSLTLQGDLSLDLVLDRNAAQYAGYYFQVINLASGRINRSNNLAQYDLVLPEVTAEKQKQLAASAYYFERASIEDTQFLIYNAGIYARQDGENKLIAVLQAAIVTQQFERFFNALRTILAIMAFITIMLASSIGWFLARTALRPIDRVIEAADQIEKGTDLGKRIDYTGPLDEIGRLTSTINSMLTRIQTAYTELEELYRAQRRFVSDASHELRTPLTTIRGNVDLLEKMWNKTALMTGDTANSGQLELSLEAMHDIAGEAERMSRLVNDLLSLARADAGFEMAKEPIQVKPLVEDVIRKANLLPRTVLWKTGDMEALDGVAVHGNRDYLQQLIFIFIENAFKYTDSGYVMLDAIRSADQIGIRIEDTGIGMDKEDVPNIFDRFYRADPSRGQKSGTGLGLSIAKWIIDEHHGSIEVKTRFEEGTTFIVWLPISREISTAEPLSLS
jgi:two-component system OmpR family sensor kinase